MTRLSAPWFRDSGFLGSPSHRSEVLIRRWLRREPACTTRDRWGSSSHGSGVTKLAWATWSGFGGRTASCVPITGRVVGVWPTVVSAARIGFSDVGDGRNTLPSLADAVDRMVQRLLDVRDQHGRHFGVEPPAAIRFRFVPDGVGDAASPAGCCGASGPRGSTRVARSARECWWPLPSNDAMRQRPTSR